jgi:hypothetical protein
MDQPLVSIVILCWNRKEDVREGLQRIKKQTYLNFEVIVVDNSSFDGTQEMIESEFPEVKLIRMFKNIGIEAYNIGFENAKGEYIVILDDDSFPKEDALEKMVQKFEADLKLGVVAFDVRNYLHYDDVKQIKEQPSLETKAKAQDYLLAFNGAGAGVRRDVFKKIGYYPEEFFLYWNEPDTAFRILDAGYSIQFFSDVISYHKYSPKNRSSWRAPYYYTRNMFWLIWKNYPADMAFAFTLKSIYNCFYYSMEQKTTVYVKALWGAFLGIYILKGKRKEVDRDIAERLRLPFYVSFTFYR